MRENLTSGSMRGGWNRNTEAKTIYAPAGNRWETLVGQPAVTAPAAYSTEARPR